MRNPRDIYGHSGHVIGSEKLPCGIFVNDTIILHQVVSRKVSAVDQRQGMKQKEVPADSYGVRSNGGLVVGQCNLAVRAVSIRPQSGTGILRLLHHGGLRQSTVYPVLKHQNGILRGFGIRGKETAYLRRIVLLAPPPCHLLGILRTYDLICRNKQDQENQKR